MFFTLLGYTFTVGNTVSGRPFPFLDVHTVARTGVGFIRIVFDVAIYLFTLHTTDADKTFSWCFAADLS
jgi:hypothetical protein